MLYRLLAGTIVVFWITMTALLVRKELGVGDPALRAVPVAHVVRMMLQREQASELQIFSEKSLVGRLSVQPQVRREDGQREFNTTGRLQVALPGGGRQRVEWSGELELGAALAVERLKATANLHDPPLMVDVTIDVAAKRLTYELQEGPQLLKRMQYSLDEEGVRHWLRDQDIDPNLFGSLQSASATRRLELRAQQSELEVHGEKIETYLITAEQAGQTLMEAHISQLGQILRIRTMLGYSAAPEEMAP